MIAGAPVLAPACTQRAPAPVMAGQVQVWSSMQVHQTPVGRSWSDPGAAMLVPRSGLGLEVLELESAKFSI